MGSLFLYDKNIIFTVEAFVFIFPVLVEIKIQTWRGSLSYWKRSRLASLAPSEREDMSGMMNRHSVMNGTHTGTHFTNVADRGQGAVGQIRSGCLSVHQWPKNVRIHARSS